jgi:hypothetical protein
MQRDRGVQTLALMTAIVTLAVLAVFVLTKTNVVSVLQSGVPFFFGIPGAAVAPES